MESLSRSKTIAATAVPNFTLRYSFEDDENSTSGDVSGLALKRARFGSKNPDDVGVLIDGKVPTDQHKESNVSTGVCISRILCSVSARRRLLEGCSGKILQGACPILRQQQIKDWRAVSTVNLIFAASTRTLHAPG